MIDTRTAALTLVDNERNRQDAKWGEQNHAPEFWVGILGEEFGEYCQAVNETVFNNGPTEREKGGVDNMITELSHVAAVAVGAIECLLRHKSAPRCGNCLHGGEGLCVKDSVQSEPAAGGVCLGHEPQNGSGKTPNDPVNHPPLHGRQYRGN